MIEQIGLFDAVPEEESAFQIYHRENPQIYEEFKRFSLQIANRNRKKFGAQAVIERMRWESFVVGNDDFKVNNNYSAYYSRLFMKDFPEFEGFFRTRTAKADKEI